MLIGQKSLVCVNVRIAHQRITMKSLSAGKLSAWLIREIWQRRIGLRYNARTNTICRFYPSCSHYAIISLEKYGLIQGVKLLFGRLKRCNPSNTASTIDLP